jgi:hypothetical protein
MTTQSLQQASNQTTLDSLIFVSKPTSLGTVPVKLLSQRDNIAVEARKVTSKHESTMRNT